ncbi:MAG TPA: hypothetical protein VGC76_14190 [Pyrinomonadaceae bacterium]
MAKKLLTNTLYSERKEIIEANDLPIMENLLKGEIAVEIKRAVRNANLLSYGLLAVFLLAVLLLDKPVAR